MIEWQGATVRHRGQSGSPALDGVDLQIGAGEIVAVLGPNGAGKSTLLHSATGWAALASGRVMVAGRDTRDWSRRDLARQIALCAQNEGAPPGMTVRDVVGLGRFCHQERGWEAAFGQLRASDRAAVDAAIGCCCLEGLEHRTVESLSGGERQRVYLARALAQEPRHLFLDEPTTALDPLHQQSVARMVRRVVGEGRVEAALVVLHDLNLAAALADRIVFLVGGRLAAAGAPGEMLEPATLQRVFGLDMGVVPGPENRPLVFVPA